MERIKFEENSREKLEERELQPSGGAWNKLEAMLEEDQPSKKGGGFTWLAIAASFIGFVIIASIYFNQNDKNDSLVIEDITPEILKDEQTNSPFKTVEEINKENETVAETVNETPTIENEIIDVTSSKLKEKENRITEVATQNAQERNTTSNESNNANQLQKMQQEKSKHTKIVMSGTRGNASKISEEKTIIAASDTKEIPNENTAAVIQKEHIATAVHAQKTSSDKSREEIDALLIAAKSDIQKEQILKSKSNKVDAMALLNNIEMEQHRSLRDRVFYALGDGIEYVKENVVGIGN